MRSVRGPTPERGRARPPAAGLCPLVPDRHRLGALVRAVADHLAGHRVRTSGPASVYCTYEARPAILDEQSLNLSPAPKAILRALVQRPGEVVDRRRLLAALPGAADVHAVEVAVAQLRAGLGRPVAVETVVKRGYRLTVPELSTTDVGGEVVSSDGSRG
jgi:uroporphyrinogen-III synthase